MPKAETAYIQLGAIPLELPIGFFAVLPKKYPNGAQYKHFLLATKQNLGVLTAPIDS